MINKILLTLCCIAFSLQFMKGIAQQRPEIYLGGGLIKGNKDTHVSNSQGGGLGVYMPLLSKQSLSYGLDIGAGYFLSKKGTLSNIIPYELPGVTSNHVLDDASLSPSSNMLRFGLGPRVDFKLGKKLQLSTAVQAGMAMLKSDPVAFDQYFKAGDQEYKKQIYSREKIESNAFQLTPKLRLSYPLGNNLNVWAEGNYMLSRIAVTDERVPTVDGEGNPFKDWGQFIEAQTIGQSHKANWNALGAQLGLSFNLGKRKASPKTKPIAERSTSPLQVNQPEKGKEEEKRVLLPVTPKNNSRFDSGNALKSLGWKLVGPRLPNAEYSVELVQLDGKRRPQRTFHARSPKTEVSIDQLTKGRELQEGNYRWQVSEIGTGLVTKMQFFSVGSCAIQFEIEEESISCLGYVGENRKYQVCFNSVYQSTSGDLTYNQPSSGLTIYDQNNNVIPHTLVGAQPTLVTQVGASSSTVQYCFEVEVSPQVNSIGIGLQGDDLDPGPILCQPGVSVVLDSLPDCLCQDCDEMVLTFDPVEVNPVPSSNAFSFSGDLQVNVPIYGIEFQVLSYSYNANPTPCSGGITTIEEAGMFLRNGSTINNSSNLSLYTATGDPNNNPDASKVVSYTANNSPISGNIPIHLLVGLPGPLPGFDADCCKINYEVCFRIVLYYDPDNCKSCVFTKCFQFTN